MLSIAEQLETLIPTAITGSVASTVGMTVSAAGFPAPVGAVAEIEQHPLAALLDAGVPVTLATDDPGMFGTDLITEYRLAQRLAGLDAEGVVDLVRQGIESAFCPEDLRAALIVELDAIPLPGAVDTA